MEGILFHLLELVDDLFFYTIPYNVSTKLQLIFDLVRHVTFDDVLHIFPVRVFISEAAALGELPHPVGHRHLIRLSSIKFFDYFEIFQLQFF